MSDKLDEIAERLHREAKLIRTEDQILALIRAALDEAVAEERKRILNELSDNPLIASLLDGAREAKR